MKYCAGGGEAGQAPMAENRWWSKRGRGWHCRGHNRRHVRLFKLARERFRVLFNLAFIWGFG